MKFVWVILIAGVVLTIRLWIYQNRNAATGGRGRTELSRGLASAGGYARSWRTIEDSLGDVGLVATREIKERVRGRIFRVGTVLVLLVVGAAIIIPTLRHSGGASTQTVAIVGEPLAGSEAGRGNRGSGQQGLDPIHGGTVPCRRRGLPALGQSSISPLSTRPGCCSTGRPPRETRRPIPGWSRPSPSTSGC